MSQRGKFIIVLGGEGSGKSHMIGLLKKALHGGELHNIRTTREPGGSPFAEKIREVMFHPTYGKLSTPMTQFGLAWAARHDHMTNEIIPTLSTGTHVVCDRFDCCTYAYQGMADTRLKPVFWDMREICLGGYEPDAYIFLDVDVKTGLARAKARQAQGGTGNFFDDAAVSFHERIREGYIEFLDQVSVPQQNIIIIDANKPLVEVEAEFMVTIRRITQFQD